MNIGNTTIPDKVVLCVVLVFMLVGQCFATDQHDVVEKVNAYSHINWSQGVVYAKGTGTISGNKAGNTAGPPDAQQADSDSAASLYEAVKKIRIDTSCLVKDLVKKNGMVREQLQAMVRGAPLSKREYMSDGTVKATLAFSMRGGFAQLALPGNIKYVPEIKTISNKAGRENRPDENSSPKAPVFTGLVLDARGIKGLPAMAPRIVSESGEEIYGPGIVSREYAVQHGVVAFEMDLESARNNPRVMNNPIIVRGLRTQGTWPCDFVISDADARKIRGASENLVFLKHCMVIVVLD
jgi:hypothetical protein